VTTCVDDATSCPTILSSGVVPGSIPGLATEVLHEAEGKTPNGLTPPASKIARIKDGAGERSQRLYYVAPPLALF